jgi:hypothetical protein
MRGMPIESPLTTYYNGMADCSRTICAESRPEKIRLMVEHAEINQLQELLQALNLLAMMAVGFISRNQVECPILHNNDESRLSAVRLSVSHKNGEQQRIVEAWDAVRAEIFLLSLHDEGTAKRVASIIQDIMKIHQTFYELAIGMEMELLNRN